MKKNELFGYFMFATATFLYVSSFVIYAIHNFLVETKDIFGHTIFVPYGHQLVTWAFWALVAGIIAFLAPQIAKLFHHTDKDTKGASSMAQNERLKAKIDAVTTFLPIFQEEEFSFGEMLSPEYQPAYFEFSVQANAFLKALHDNGWIRGVHIVKELPPAYYEAGKLTAAPIPTADLPTLRHLLTYLVYGERFKAGMLNSAFESGILTAILKRLVEIRATIPTYTE